jgi:2-aminoethylphosphonate-pyruvate transaminase
MTRKRKEPFLLTPGPLTTSAETKAAMLRDWGSRDPGFSAMVARVKRRLEELAGGQDRVAVLLQGSGTYAVEAALGTLVPKGGKVLVLVNGAYGQRMVGICQRIGRACVALETAEDTPPSPESVAAALAGDTGISHVAMVHCETTSGILNPIAAIADVVARAGKRLLIDAMSSFGALSIDAGMRYDGLMASANKCLEGVPGLAFVICDEAALAASAGNAPSLSLDLHDQGQAMEKTGQFRFTPPTQVIAAFDRALDEHRDEGGVAGRGARYRRNCQVLVEGMRGLGFETFLPDAVQAPIIVTFHSPADPRFDFADFYDRLAADGYLIYPGKLTAQDTFRIGCIGRVGEAEMTGVVEAVAAAP